MKLPAVGRRASRRKFFKSVAALGVVGFAGGMPAAENLAVPAPAPDDRSYWLAVMEKIAAPVLENLSRRELKKVMPVEAAGSDRAQYTHLEAFGRLLAGLAPWLAARELAGAEARLQEKFIGQAQLCLAAATDPRSPDFMNFTTGGQPLVDTAFLAQGILRAPAALWQNLDPRVRRQIVEALKSSRAIATPARNNWVMFAALVEAALHVMGETTVATRLESCVQRMLGWYQGDGVYGDV